MYKSFSADQYREHLGFPPDYKVDGVLCYGTLFEDRTKDELYQCFKDMNISVELKALPDPFLQFAWELNINDKKIWFMIAYGGAWLGEYLHWACMFGSKKNILIGSCGGLKHGMKSGDFIIPTSSFGEESSVRIYNRKTPKQYPDDKLSKSLESRLIKDKNTIWRGPLITCQAMIGETVEDVENWSKSGYYGVEMESSTLFAVSNHFSVPSAAIVYVSDNLIEGHSCLSEGFDNEKTLRALRRKHQIKATLEELLSKDS